ncbi:BTE_HP_G0087520.mRNA.1.CDS.1 [Saccharomyces cerevisiae]|nr:BTE_HP_G0087520.mRNA.1.CDS.1 [Saccharomyces cerevisiae]CAI6950992.1 BTE_HP_G0087520.mRNA.1.CDS.1 [Saccharomyces cerevisiae]
MSREDDNEENQGDDENEERKRGFSKEWSSTIPKNIIFLYLMAVRRRSRHGSPKISVKTLKDSQPQQQIPLQPQLEGAIEIEKKEESDSESLPQLQPAVSRQRRRGGKEKNKKRSNTTEISNQQHSKTPKRRMPMSKKLNYKLQLKNKSKRPSQASAPVQTSGPVEA